MQIKPPARLRSALSALLALEAGQGAILRERAMARIEVTLGTRFGKLSILEETSPMYLPCGQHNRMFICKCDCGNTTTVSLTHLRKQKGATQSCGCLRHDGSSKVIHGMSHSPTWVSWRAMKQRCEYENQPHFSHYGGRGITVCDRWSNSFEAFVEDMGERPPGLTLDRIDNDKGYSKENCRWATHKEQARHRKGNKMITYQGETRCISDWSELIDIPADTLNWRLINGWSVEKSMTTPVRANVPKKNGGTQT